MYSSCRQYRSCTEYADDFGNTGYLKQIGASQNIAHLLAKEMGELEFWAHYTVYIAVQWCW